MTPLSQFQANWPAISALLDEALMLSAPDRAAWIEGLAGEHAVHRDSVRLLLAHQADVETDDFLKALPRLDLARDPAHTQGPSAGDLVGAYRLIESIGQGGMGTVWLAERADGLVNRKVALKLPRVVWGGAFAERLARERSILATLEHEHIARLYDAGLDAEGRPFLAMEFVEGQALDAYLRGRALSLRERMTLLLQVMSAVSHAHARLVVHRDLKPGNILVTATGQVKLLDFGIAKLLEGEHAHETALTELAGRALTLDYASPEQIRGQPLGTASDIYSMGVVAYEVLSGARPYRLKRGSAAEIEEAIASVEPPLASSRAADKALAKALRGDLDSMLNKALKKSPGDRYVTMDAFAQDVLRWSRNEPVQAQPDTLSYRARKYLARHRLQAAAVALISITLTVGTTVSLWQAREARSQAQRAATEATTATAAQAFLEGVFKSNAGDQADPVRARQTTARELLDRGAERIDVELKDAPAARVKLYGTLSRMYADMGLYDKATVLARRRMELVNDLPGQTPLARVDAMLSLAYLLQAVNKRGEALELLQRSTAALDATSADTTPARVGIDISLAQGYYSIDPAKSLVLAQRAASAARALSLTPDLVSALQMIGESSLRLSNNAQAQSALKEALTLVERQPELGGGFLSEMYSTLADAQNRAGERREAEATFAKALQAAKRGAGRVGSPYSAANKLAISQYINGHYAEGIATMQAPAAWVRQLPGKGTPGQFPVKMLGTLGRALTTYGHPEEGLATLDEGLALLEKRALADEAPAPEFEGPLLAMRVEALSELGRFEEAEIALARSLVLIGNNPSQDGFAFGARRRLWIATGRADLALKDFDGRPFAPGLDPTGPMGRHAERAWLAVSAGQHDLAHAEAEAALRAIETSPSREYLRDAEAKASFALGLALLHAQDAAAATAPLRRAEVLRRSMYDPKRSLALADVLIAQSAAKSQTRDKAGASRAWAEARAIHASHASIGAQRAAALKRAHPG